MTRKHSSPAAAAPPPVAPYPRLASLRAALVYLACALAFAYPALVGRFLVNPNSDQYKAGYAFREFASSYMKATGGFPQWNPYLLGGMPYVASMNGDIFYPTFLLRLVLPVDVAMTWGMIAHFVLCGLATFWFLRRAARVSFPAALLGGVAYMMGGFVSSLVSAGHDGKLFVSSLLPVALLVITWGVRDGRRWAWGVLALVVGLAVLSPHPQLLQYLLLCAGAWAVFLAYGGIGAEALSRAQSLTRLACALGAVLVGMMIGAIQYLPVFGYVPFSPRGPGYSYGLATQFSFPIEELLNTYLPQFSGILGAYWGRNQFHFHSEYVGVVVLMFAAAAFGAGWAGARKRFLWFWTGVGVVTLLWALGDSTPFFHLVYTIVPGTKFFRAPSTIFYVTTFAIAMMAAFGVERFVIGKLSTRYAYGWLIGAAVIAFLGLAGGLTGLAEGLAVDPGRVAAATANAGAVRLGAIRCLIFVGLACAVIVLARRKRLATNMAAYALVALAAIDLWSVERLYWEFSPPASVIFAKNATTDYLRQLPQPARVLALAIPSATSPAAPGDPFLNRDALMTHRVRMTNGYHGNEIARWDDLASAEQTGDQYFNPTFLSLTNTDFLLVNADSLPLPGMTRVAGPVRDAEGTSISLFRLAGEHPYAWVTPAIAKFPDAAILGALRAPNFPVRSVALLDTSSRVPGVQLSTAPAPLAITTSVTTYEPGHVVLSLSAPAPKGSALVVSENYYPGWRATIDGAPAAVERTDYTLIGVPLPEGARRVELSFASDAYARGKTITIVALVLAFGAAIAGVVLEHR